MWVNVFGNCVTKKYLLLTDDDIESILQVMDEHVYSDDILKEDGYEILTANLHTFDGAAKWVKQYYPEYSEIKYQAVPISFKTAKEFINKYHRHHGAPQGHKFSVAVTDGQNIVGVAIAGRPVSRYLDDHNTLEITRLCVKYGYKNVCSQLYAKVLKIAKEMGYKRVITYILESEHGTTVKASGFVCEGKAGGIHWTGSRNKGQSIPHEMKTRWSKILAS